MASRLRWRSMVMEKARANNNCVLANEEKRASHNERTRRHCPRRACGFNIFSSERCACPSISLSRPPVDYYSKYRRYVVSWLYIIR